LDQDDGRENPVARAVRQACGAGAPCLLPRSPAWPNERPTMLPMIIDLLRQEHRNIEKLLRVLEQELNVFDRGERPDYEVIGAVIAYFEVYPGAYHHPQEDKIFEKLRARAPAAAAKVGDLAAEHRSGAERLGRLAQAVKSILADREVLRQTVDKIVRDF